MSILSKIKLNINLQEVRGRVAKEEAREVEKRVSKELREEINKQIFELIHGEGTYEESKAAARLVSKGKSIKRIKVTHPKAVVLEAYMGRGEYVATSYKASELNFVLAKLILEEDKSEN